MERAKTPAVTLRRVDPQTFRRYGDLVEQWIYVHPNPVVRWIFWRRLHELLGLGPRAGRVALDFGCGEGALLPSLSAHWPVVVAVDEDIRAATRLVRDHDLSNVRLLAADGNRLPLASASVDVVVAADVLEHFKVLATPLAEIARVLRPNGVILVSAPMEHAFYRLGRRVFGFVRPEDHYHGASGVVAALRERFDVVTERRSPFNVPSALAAFLLVGARKAGRLGV